MKDKTEIGILIQESRRKKNLTQKELADLLKVSDKAISNWETGKNYPDYGYLNDLSKILEINFQSVEEKNKHKKYIILIIVSIFLSLFLILGIYFINNYNTFTLYAIKSDSKDITIKNSYITKTKNNLVITLGSIENEKYPIQPTYSLELYYKSNEKEYEIINIENYTNTTIHTEEKDVIKNLKNLYICLKYNDKQEIIKLNLHEIESNNNFFFKQVNNLEKIDPNIENLLYNNQYNKIETNIYQKNTKSNKFTYDLKKQLLIYEKSTDDITCKAEFDIKERKITYIFLRNNKIVEELNHGDEYIPEKHTKYDEIYKILINEYKKITL